MTNPDVHTSGNFYMFNHYHYQYPGKVIKQMHGLKLSEGINKSKV